MSFTRKFSIKEKLYEKAAGNSEVDFDSYSAEMHDYLLKKHTESKQASDLFRKALQGDNLAKAFYMSEASAYVRSNPSKVLLPEGYKDLTTALFNENYGMSHLDFWFNDSRYAMSSKLQIIGDKIRYSVKGAYKQYPVRLRNTEKIISLARVLMIEDEKAKLDASNPKAEFSIRDPLWPDRIIRVSVWIPPRTKRKYPTITFRRQIVEYLTVKELVGLGTVPYEAVQMLEALLSSNLSCIVAGPVESGKTTFANTVVGLKANKHSGEDCRGILLIENPPESILPEVLQDHRVIPMVVKPEDLMEVNKEALRHDPNIFFYTEMRYEEWVSYYFAAGKGYDDLVGTFHTQSAADVPYQSATAVHKKEGGSLAAHLMTALSCTELIISLESVKGGAKKLSSVSEICYNPLDKEIYSNDLVRYNKFEDKWYYNSKLFNVINKVRQNDKDLATSIEQELQKLEQIRKIENPKKVSLESKMVLGYV